MLSHNRTTWVQQVDEDRVVIAIRRVGLPVQIECEGPPAAAVGADRS